MFDCSINKYKPEPAFPVSELKKAQAIRKCFSGLLSCFRPLTMALRSESAAGYVTGHGAQADCDK